MGFFDDFQLLNAISVRMYGSCELPQILTRCHYIGVMQGTVIIDDHEETTPIVYLTPCGIRTVAGWHSPPGKHRDNLYIECTGKRADRIMEAFEVKGKTRFIFIREIAPFAAKLNEIRQLFSAGDLLHHSRIVICMEEFTALLEEHLLRENNPAMRRYDLEKLLLAISREPGKHWNFAACAAEAGLTLRHWNRIFSAAAGMPPHRFVNFCRVKLARELLTSTTLSIKEIAGRCGFEGASDFSRFFRKNTASTPGEYRKSRLL